MHAYREGIFPDTGKTRRYVFGKDQTCYTKNMAREGRRVGGGAENAETR